MHSIRSARNAVVWILTRGGTACDAFCDSIMFSIVAFWLLAVSAVSACEVNAAVVNDAESIPIAKQIKLTAFKAAEIDIATLRYEWATQYESMQANDNGGYRVNRKACKACLLYTSDAADERSSVDLGGRRI